MTTVEKISKFLCVSCGEWKPSARPLARALARALERPSAKRFTNRTFHLQRPSKMRWPEHRRIRPQSTIWGKWAQSDYGVVILY